MKKVNLKNVAKNEISVIIADALEAAGYTVNDGTDYGFSAASLVAESKNTDVQIKLIVPKAKVERYEMLEDEDEDEVIEGPAE